MEKYPIFDEAGVLLGWVRHEYYPTINDPVADIPHPVLEQTERDQLVPLAD